MKSKAGVYIGLAVAFWGYAPYIGGEKRIALFAVAIFLTLSAIVFFSHNISSRPWWMRIVNILGKIRIGYIAAGFGFLGAGISFLLPAAWVILGIIFLIISACLIGAGISINLRIFKR